MPIEVLPNLIRESLLILPHSQEYAQYNAIEIPLGGGENLLLARQVPIASVGENGPDVGRLGQWLIGNHEPRFIGYLDPKLPPGFNSEDPRKKLLPNGLVNICITALRPDTKPAAALVIAKPTAQGLVNVQSIVFNMDLGKDFTPFLNHTFLFRREGKDNFHTLDVVEIIKHPVPHLETIRQIKFEPNYWTKEKIGTQGPPIVLKDGRVLVPIHGIRIDNGRYIYNLGFALLDENLNLLQISPHPFYSREDFNDVLASGEELHPDIRDALYSCDGYQEGEDFVSIISPGDLVIDRRRAPMSRVLASIE